MFACPRQLHRCLIAMRGGKRRWVKITVALSALFLPLAVSAPAFAYNGPAAASYADTWALGYNSNYLTFGDDCTNFVSQALKAGGLPTITTTSTTSDDHYWFLSFYLKGPQLNLFSFLGCCIRSFYVPPE